MAGSLYERYEERFKKIVKNSKYFADNTMYKKEEFKEIFESSEEDFIKIYGYKPTKNEVIRHIIDSQQYETSRKQGNAIRAAMRKHGYDVSLEDVRRSLIYTDSGRIIYNKNPDEAVKAFFNKVDERYWEERNKGMSSKDAKLLIARVFFGSP